ncbi:DUF3800 domain-containing protein [Duganella sp. FT109W]|uniref:DUF3800 domain-containing protein n=1 Tax=Duganella margarita TaxID=2692170 RepID=A0ABW9WFB1_9BURK|nr:DUF3800 domain-containing protein [Duganella margarita]MYN39168.1 DUF3800 domain-containing protein [Duganella margarita]
MYLIFFDEAKNDPDYPHYHLAAIGIKEENFASIEQRVNELSSQAFGTAQLSAATEFHAAEIYHRKKNFKEWTDVGRRISLIGEFIDILSLGEVELIDIQINCANLHAEQSPEDIAFMFMVERTSSLMRSKSALGMLIGDRESDRHADRFGQSLSRYRIEGTDFAFGKQITNMVDSVHFTQSHLSRFLQLADVYVWLCQYRNRHRGSKEDRHRAVLELLQREHVDLFPSKYKTWPK